MCWMNTKTRYRLIHNKKWSTKTSRRKSMNWKSRSGTTSCSYRRKTQTATKPSFSSSTRRLSMKEISFSSRWMRWSRTTRSSREKLIRLSTKISTTGSPSPRRTTRWSCRKEITCSKKRDSSYKDCSRLRPSPSPISSRLPPNRWISAFYHLSKKRRSKPRSRPKSSPTPSNRPLTQEPIPKEFSSQLSKCPTRQEPFYRRGRWSTRKWKIALCRGPRCIKQARGWLSRRSSLNPQRWTNRPRPKRPTTTIETGWAATRHLIPRDRATSDLRRGYLRKYFGLCEIYLLSCILRAAFTGEVDCIPRSQQFK